jgi:hypothetical protein
MCTQSCVIIYCVGLIAVKRLNAVSDNNHNNYYIKYLVVLV